MGCRMGGLHQEFAQPGTAFGGSSREPFASALMVARAHASPRGEVARCGKARHVDANLGKNTFRRPPTDPSNATKQDNGLCPGQRRGVWYVTLVCAPGRRGFSRLF